MFWNTILHVGRLYLLVQGLSEIFFFFLLSLLLAWIVIKGDGLLKVYDTL